MESTKQIRGYIGYFGLTEWWIITFTEDEKKYIIERYRKYRPRSGPESLLEGNVYVTPSTNVSSYLNFLTFIFRKPNENTIARKINKESLKSATDINNLDSALYWAIILNYTARNTVPDALELTIDACLRKIELAPKISKWHRAQFSSIPLGKHEGYSRLAKIYEAQHKYEEVIKLAEAAKTEGWKGDWDLRIERCSKRIHKQSLEQ